MFDPNYTVTSTGGSIVAPGALVLGENFNLDLDLAHTNTWTAVQNFDGGLTGTTGAFSGVVSTGATFNGNLQYTWTAGEALTSGSFNNSADKTFNVLYDNSTIGLNGSNQLYVKASGITATELANNAVTEPKLNMFNAPADKYVIKWDAVNGMTWADASVYVQDPITGNGTLASPLGLAYQATQLGLNGSNELYVISGGITTTEIANGTILNADMNDPNYTITSNGSVTVPGALVLGEDFALSLNMANSNTWTAAQTFDGLTANTADILGTTNIGLSDLDLLTVNSTSTFNGSAYFLDGVTSNVFIGALDKTLSTGLGLVASSFNNLADVTFDVAYDDVTIGVDGITNELFVKDDAITEPKLAMNNAPGAGYVIKWNNAGSYMEWADAAVYVDAPITGDGTSANHLGLAYNSSLTLDGTDLGINLTHTNTWGIKQIFNTTIADAAVEVRSDIDGLAFSVSKGTASFTGGQVQVNVADNVVGSTNPLFVVQQSGTDGGGVLIQNSGVGAPALDIYQSNAAQPALNINQGSVVMSNNSYAADGALDLQFTVHAITGGTTYTAAAGINGQFIYVVNTTGGIITVNGTNVAAGTAATFVYAGGWYKVN
jgi:hypothetical protein